MSITIIQVTEAALVLRDFINPLQLSVLGDCCRTEEGRFFREKMVVLAELIKAMPKTYEQEDKGEDAIVYLHYFLGGCDWFITEKDKEEEQLQAFGLADMGCPEMGYISIVELLENNVELDLDFTPKPLAEVKRQYKTAA